MHLSGDAIHSKAKSDLLAANEWKTGGHSVDGIDEKVHISPREKKHISTTNWLSKDKKGLLEYWYNQLKKY